MSAPQTIVIAGGGFAAVNAIEALRESGYDGRIVLVSEEAALPYDRPPLSKAYLAGTQPVEQLAFHDEAWYRGKSVDYELGQKVVSMDLGSRRVSLSGGGHVGYDRLLLVTGARARTLNGVFERAGLPLLYLRTREDADRLRAVAGPGKRVVLVGGGVIGMETAATLAGMGSHVTVLEALDRIMARFFPPELSAWLEAQHRSRGVDIRTRSGVDAAERTASGAVLRLKDGATIEADAILVGVGVVPNAELAAAAGLTIRLQGIEVDAQARTADDHVFAAGDVAAFQDRGTWTRWENWTHAKQQGRAAANAMLGKDVSYREVPWVWSDQYDFNLQGTGSPQGDALMRGDPASGRFTCFHLRDGRVVGATTVNEGKHKLPIRKLVELQAAVEPAKLADPGVDLKKLVASL
ncbi:MAG TPA: FAD-dependent oxidoreductase [Nevskiaceae bacterium]|nr:FAD-dependent oxidoreductase [Nevskiaceae bacterium]